MIEQARELLDELHAERLSYGEYCLLRNALDTLEAERDAAVEDLRMSAVELAEGTGTCIVCKHYPSLVSSGTMGVCSECAAGGCLFDWRGPQEAGEESKNG